MSNTQLYIAIGIPMLFNLALYAGLRAEMKSGFDAINTRFNDMRAIWTSELNRVEGIIDARLKHLEER
jgi:hypothetical protein